MFPVSTVAMVTVDMNVVWDEMGWKCYNYENNCMGRV